MLFAFEISSVKTRLHNHISISNLSLEPMFNRWVSDIGSSVTLSKPQTPLAFTAVPTEYI